MRRTRSRNNPEGKHADNCPANWRLRKKSPDDPPHGSINVIDAHGERFRRVPEMKPPTAAQDAIPVDCHR
ncbi:hypothetical protein PHISP_03170 [Aspergillus sp. HF37]|nr:hypothetical protein PHISP_03170 [Aspergillus sp. HF37]